MLRLATATTFRPPCGAGAERIAGLHSYDVPAAVIWSIERSLPAYAEWDMRRREPAEAAATAEKAVRYYNTFFGTVAFLDFPRPQWHLAVQQRRSS